MQIAVISADPALDITFLDIDKDHGYLEALQELVSGDIEVVDLHRYAMNMYLNENGKIEGLPANHRATMLAHWAAAVRADDIIVGDVVLTGPVDAAGEDTPIVANHKWWLLQLNDEAAPREGHS
jgi:hypothetical protein